jgi:putative glycosyltransferase (TIGR04372 family)
MKIHYIKNFIKKRIDDHRKHKIFYLRAIIHLIRYFLLKDYRKNVCLIDPGSDFFYKYKKLVNYFSIPLLIIARYLKKKKIFISIDNEINSSIGHVYAEIGFIKKMQHLEDKYYGSTIWFTTSRKEILGDTKHIFETKNFKVLFGGLKRIIITFIAIKDPSISINGSLGRTNYILGRDNSYRHEFQHVVKKRARLMNKSDYYFPNKYKLSNYNKEKIKLLQSLNIKKKYLVIQIKTEKVNGTLKIINPDLLLKTIKYFQDKDYQIVFAGREKFPDTFLNKSIINYANSKYTSALNDFILVGHCSFVICSASGFCELPYSLDKATLVINVHHIFNFFGRRMILVPTLLSRKSRKFNAKIQHIHLCTYGNDAGYDTFDDFYILHMPNSEEIFMAAKELEGMLTNIIPSFTPLQKKIRSNANHPLITDGLSRISNYYLTKHGYFFEK